MATRHYLDTSAQIERHAGESGVREQFAKALAGTTHATSTHVRREWKSVVHGGAVAVLNACQGAEDVGDVRARLRQAFGRKPGQNWLTFDMIGAESADVFEIEIRAEQFLRTRADALFELDVDEIRDGSECMLAKESAHQEVVSGRWWIRQICKREECDCNQVAFTDSEAARVDQAAAALAASSTSGHKRMARIAREAMAAPDKTKRKGTTCWGGNGLGGDISIALECREDETLIATDRSYDEICPAIGIRHLRLASTRTP
jgi:hypothetical protein